MRAANPHAPATRFHSPGGWVYGFVCDMRTCGATTPGSACYRMAAGGVLGGDASGAPHASFMMVPAAPRRIDARGSDSL